MAVDGEMMNKIHRIKIKVNNVETDNRDVTSEVLNSIKQNIEQNFAAFGLSVKINKIEDGELFAKNYYESKGYHVITMNPLINRCRGGCSKEDDYITKILTYFEDKFDTKVSINSKGVPDFLVFKFKEKKSTYRVDKTIKDAFFVEVKKNNDGLRLCQFKWIMDHPQIPHVLFFIGENLYN